MLFLLFFYHLAFAKALPFLNGPAEDTPQTSCNDINHCRKVTDIIWSCIATLIACTWLSIHPNIPPPIRDKDLGGWFPYSVKLFFTHRAPLFLMALLVPEWILCWAIQQRVAAGRFVREADAGRRGWTLTEAFFILMGGFHVFTPREGMSPGKPCYPLDPYKALYLANQEKIELPSEEDIMDKSKVDGLAKMIVLLQTTWFLVQCVARGITRLHITELELITLAYTIMNIGIYIAWWDKPYNIRRPVPVYPSDAIPLEISEKWEEDKTDSWIEYLEWKTRDLTPGDTGNIPYAEELKSLPRFYVGNTGLVKRNICNAISLLFGIVFGAIHCIAWSFTFASPLEQLLWRVSSITMIGVPLTILISFGGCLFSDKFGGVIGSLICKWIAIAWYWTMTILFFLSLSLGGLMYAAARIVTFVLAFKALASPSLEALQTIPWVKLVPHV